MNPLALLLALWQIGFVSDAEAGAWLNAELVSADAPSEALLDLVCHGPAKCLSWSEQVFPLRPLKLSYRDEFALRGLVLDLEEDEDVGRFASWAFDACRYEDSQDERVKFGCKLGELYLECCDESGAIEHVKHHMPTLRDSLLASARDLAGAVPGLVSSRLQ